MTDNDDLRNDAADNAAQGDEATAQQAVVDRVLSWQEGAPVEQVRDELRRVAAEVGVDVDDAWVEDKAQQIHQADPASS